MVLAALMQTVPVQPPDGSPPVVKTIEIRFPAQNNISLVEPTTYLYYIQTRPSRPSENAWVPYNPDTARADFARLWSTGFLDDLSVEVRDEPYPNGVVGKHLIYQLEEKRRVRLVEYTGTKVLDTQAIEDRLKEQQALLRLDTFFDASNLRTVESIVRRMLQEKGYPDADVTHAITSMDNSPKVARITFTLSEGPQVRVKRVIVTGNQALTTRAIVSQIRTAPGQKWWLPGFLERQGPFREDQFAEDADRIVQAYRDRGFINASVGTPRVDRDRPSRDGRTQWVTVTVPVTEGRRYTVDSVTFEGNTVFGHEQLATLFAPQTHRFYDEGQLRKGLQKARDAYGAAGYYEFTGYPDLRRSDAADAAVPPPSLADQALPPTVSVVLRLQEGPKYFVNRLNIAGNTVTRDNVIRRELGLADGGVFSTDALKTGVRRLNQLGYFKPIDEAKHITIDKVADTPNQVDVTLRVEEQNRSQLNFGAGVSQYEGVFGNITFSTSNFLGRGETLSVTGQAGQRSNLREVSFTEPYLFNRPISASASLYSRKVDYYTSASTVGYSEVREGSNWSVGRLLSPFTRAYLNYTYEIVHVSISDGLVNTSTGSQAGTPSFNLFADAGRHIDSRITPSLVFNTVDNPIMPHRGVRLTASAQVAGHFLNGGYDYLKPEAEAVWWIPVSRRTGFGLRANGGWLRTFGSTSSTSLPYYFRYFLGGDQQIRGVDIRTVGPVDSGNRALGGNKFALFNAEYYVDLFGPVRLVFFHDAGQAFAESERVNLRNLRTSSGAELRFMMPVLNVPFRLIYALNTYRDTFQPAHSFRFSVGTTF